MAHPVPVLPISQARGGGGGGGGGGGATRADSMVLTTGIKATSVEIIRGMALQTLKYRSFLSKKRLLWPFLDTVLEFTVQSSLLSKWTPSLIFPAGGVMELYTSLTFGIQQIQGPSLSGGAVHKLGEDWKSPVEGHMVECPGITMKFFGVKSLESHGDRVYDDTGGRRCRYAPLSQWDLGGTI
ncbi:unnamed protein product [Lota lota]